MFINDLEALSSQEKSWADEVLNDFENVYNKNQEYLDFVQPWIDEIELHFGKITNITHKEIL